MDNNQRKFIRIETTDFIEIRPSDGIGSIPKKLIVKDFSMMGVCFYCPIQWCYGQALTVSYVIPGSMEEVEMRLKVMWSELVDETRGYLIGTSILYIESNGVEAFLRYYSDEISKLTP